jgi:hypothetical protein
MLAASGSESRNQTIRIACCLQLIGLARKDMGPMSVFVYFNTSKQVGYPEHIKLFATADAAAKFE